MLRAETRDGFAFTPRYGVDRQPTIWRPDEWDGRVPRSQVSQAIDELFERFDVQRVYCDPWRWESDVDEWALRYPDDQVLVWDTSRVKPMHEALERFYTDLSNDRIRHDGCPLTAICMGNARKVAKPSDRYLLAKPSPMQKIDAAMATVLAHEAAADARAAGWGTTDTRVFAFS